MSIEIGKVTINEVGQFYIKIPENIACFKRTHIGGLYNFKLYLKNAFDKVKEDVRKIEHFYPFHSSYQGKVFAVEILKDGMIHFIVKELDVDPNLKSLIDSLEGTFVDGDIVIPGEKKC